MKMYSERDALVSGLARHVGIGDIVGDGAEEPEEEYPAPEGGWARCEHHVEQLGLGAPRPCRRVATTEDGLAGSTGVIPRPWLGSPSRQLV